MIRAVILWVHVLCGVVWVGACAVFILAAAASAGDPNESLAFAARAVPPINRLCLVLAIAIPLTGIGNLFFVARARGSALPAEFLGILAAKISLLVVMGVGLWGAWRAAAILQGASANPGAESRYEVSLHRIMASYGLIVAAGVGALGLGLWLSGT